MLSVSEFSRESQFAAEVQYLFRVAYRLTGDSHDAEDLVQDVIERALTKAPAMASSTDWRRWLLRVLYNRFVDGQRQRKRSPIVSPGGGEDIELAAGSDPAKGPEELASQRDAEATLMHAWEKLQPDQRMLLMLSAEGFGLGEISMILQVDKPALSSRLHRARSTLSRYLEQARGMRPQCANAENRR